MPISQLSEPLLQRIAREHPEIFDVVRQMVGKRARGFLAPEYNIRCVEAAVNQPFDEGIALRASDIDVVYLYGYGWPVYRGGPMHYANSLGLDKVVGKLRQYKEFTGDGFWEPSPLLVSLAEKGESFK